MTREGTDYGAQDVSLATKVWQVRHQLDAGTAVVVYDEGTESRTDSAHAPALRPPLTDGFS